MTSSSSIPYHIGIIMDGNGRWASQKGLPRSIGHKKGAEVVKNVVESAANYGIKALTLFAFSEENWKRSNTEVSLLMELAEHYIDAEVDTLVEQGVRFKVIGNREKLPTKLKDLIQSAEEKTKHNKKLCLNIALSYSSRQDIISAVKSLVDQQVDITTLTEETFSQHLSLGELPNPDLIIRTSGEQRLSNFLLWESAYSELYFTAEMWPEFTASSLRAAIESYQQRHRRFGAVVHAS